MFNLELFYDLPLSEFYISILMEYASRNQTKSQEALLRVLYLEFVKESVVKSQNKLFTFADMYPP